MMSATEYETLSPELKQIQEEAMEKCTCGRSPTGFCAGWHGLSTQEYMAKMKEYKQQRGSK